jgi:hypothetical protein
MGKGDAASAGINETRPVADQAQESKLTSAETYMIDTHTTMAEFIDAVDEMREYQRRCFTDNRIAALHVPPGRRGHGRRLVARLKMPTSPPPHEELLL